MRFNFHNWSVPSCIFLLTLVLLVAGCSVNPEKHPAFQKLKTMVEELGESQAKTARSVERLFIDVDMVTEDMNNLKQELQAVAGGASPEDMQKIMAQVNALDGQLKQMRATLAKQQTDMADLNKRVSSAQTKAAQAAERARASVAGAPKAPTQSQATSAPKPKGAYYQIMSGDTLESLAQKNGLQPGDILKANNLPQSSTLHPGQMIYIPAK